MNGDTLSRRIRRSGIKHRDVKPDNIVIERDSGRPIVTDSKRAALGHQTVTLRGGPCWVDFVGTFKVSRRY